MKRKKSIGKTVFIFFVLAMLFSVQGTLWPVEAAASDEASGQREEWSKFKNQYSNAEWRIEWDKKTGTPRKITGGNIKASVFGIDTVTEDNMDALARSFFGAYKELLKINHSDLEIVKLRGNKALKVISYRQLYSTIPVFNSHVTLAVKNNKIVEFKANYHTDISVSTTPRITREEAVHIARGFFHVKDKGKKSKDPNLIIYPLAKEGDYALTYEVALPVIDNPAKEREKNKPYIQPTVFVDAHTGAIRDVIENMVYSDLSGTVTGLIYPVFTDTPQVQSPFKNNWIYANGIQGMTNQNGLYSISGLTGNVNVSAHLDGPWSAVFNVQQNAAFHSATISVPGTHNWNWASNDASYKQEESNAFYHTNVIHDYITKPSLGAAEMNLQMQVYVNDPNTCNAASSGDSLYFLSASASCESTALDAGVIYHEYGHGINSHLVPVYWPYWDQTGNMNEGLADYWGITVLNDPCSGKFLYGVACDRSADTFRRYPDNYDPEPHAGAQIISGAFWDTRKVLGADSVDSLAVDALRLGPMTFSDLLEDVLIADDDNGNLSDGTPNGNVICHSFWDLHGVFSGYCAGHTQAGIAEITSPPPVAINFFKDGVITIQGSAYGNASDPFVSYTLEYANQNNPENWSTAGITITGGEVVNGVLGQWDISSLGHGSYDLRVTITYGAAQYSSYPVTIRIDKDMKDGWPVFTQNWIGTSPLIGDLDGNGYSDVIMGSWSPLYALNHDGTFLPGWGSIGMCTSVGKPAMGDIDGNGDKEAVFADLCGNVQAYHHDGTLYWGFWTGNYDYILGSPALIDLNNDGKLETIIGSDNGSLYVLDYQGKLLWSAGTAGKIRSSVAVGDINGDGVKEIVATSFNNTTQEFKIYIYTRDGAYVTAPISVPLTDPYTGIDYYLRYESAPALADLDNDGHLEIVLGLPDGSLGAWKYDGTLVWRYYDASLTYEDKMMRSPAIGDIDNDGHPEIVTTTITKAYVLRHTGTLVDHWPVTRSGSSYYSASAPVLYDLDGDGYLEIIMPTYEKIGIYRHDGTEIYTDKFHTYGYSFGTAAVGDLDNNGKPDIVFGSYDGYIYAWEVEPNAAASDLVVSTISVSPTGLAGGNITLSYIGCNQGTAIIDTIYFDGIYLSSDAIITPEDYGLFTLAYPGNSGACHALTNYTFTLPSSIRPGIYHIGAITDLYGQILESNENNNTRAGNAINVQAMLTVTRSGAGAGTVTGVPAGINCGAACSAAYDANTNVTLTAAANAGSAFANWSGCDSVNGNTCTVTMNNSRTVNAAFNVGQPDLIEAALTVSQSGTNLRINDRVANQGTGSAGAFDIRYYLSVDPTYQAGTDIYVCKRSVASLAPGASNPPSGSTQTSCPVPNVAAGNYFVIAIADSGSTVAESSETNNNRSATVTISGIDLVPTAMTATKSGTTTVLVSETVKNQGSSRAGSFTIRYYLSTDTTYQSGTDIALAGNSNRTGICSRTVSSLNAGSSRSVSNKACYKPGGAVNGVNYYVIVVDDTGNTVSENNETNNSKPTSGTIRW